MKISDVEVWWDKVKDMYCWSGAYRNFRWDDLWPEAKDEIKSVFELARNIHGISSSTIVNSD